MSPGRRYAQRKTTIGLLLEAYFQEMRIRFWGLGSTTFRRSQKRGGIEPDECYCIGREKELPDLAIEVIETSGGIDTLAVYAVLGIAEVWFWPDDRFTIHCLQVQGYQAIQTSQAQARSSRISRRDSRVPVASSPGCASAPIGFA